MSGEDIILYELKSKVANIALNRPAAAHSFNLDLMKKLFARLVEADEDERVKCLLLKSTGNRMFSAGIDIKSKSLEDNKEYFEEIALLLIKNGIDIHKTSGYYKATPLHFAAESGSLEVVNLLIEKDANVKAEDDYKLTPLHFAAENGHLKIVNRLI